MSLELRPAGVAVVNDAFQQVVWGAPGTASDISSNLDSWLTELGDVSAPAVDFVRLATGAYLADRGAKRQTGFSRSLHLNVHVRQPDVWGAELERLTALLAWVSNDEWLLELSQDSSPEPIKLPNADSGYETVALLSGGLDSCCGAALNGTKTIYVSHSDSNPVTRSQNRVWTWLNSQHLVSGSRRPLELAEAGSKVERSTRTRSLLFYALAVAVADANGVHRVVVPENGFTSLNIPLGNDRGGALSTRSTHPWTIHCVNALLRATGIDVVIENPHELLTKGELIDAAAAVADGLVDGAALTLSCAKLDGNYLKGGNANHNCGLCVACLTRRAGLYVSSIEDKTPYLCETLAKPQLKELESRRRSDVQAVLVRVGEVLDEFDLVGVASFPDDFDLTAGADLANRGFDELRKLLEATG